MKKFCAAVVGVGYLGNFHVQKYLALDNVDLVGLVETEPARRREIAEKYAVPAYDSIDGIIGQVDLVSIVVPPKYHYPLAKTCLEAGINVLLEKPVTETVGEAEALIKIAQAKDLVFQVGHLERFNPAVIALKERVSNPKKIHAERLSPYRARGTEVNVILDLMIHDIDIVLSLVDSSIEDISASGQSIVTGDIDVAHATLRFVNGCQAKLSASRANQDQVRSMTITEARSFVSVDYLNHEMITGKVDENGNVAEQTEDAFVTKTAVGRDILMAEIKSFINSVEQGHQPTVTGEDGKRALEVAIDVSRAIYAESNIQVPSEWTSE
ncbi:MAG: Gfo/Idh/MocA family oxidoreductase [Pseudomonadota bacterium]